MLMRIGSLLLLGALAVTSATAQDTPFIPHDRLDIAVMYTTARSNQNTGNSFWLQGGSTQADARVWRSISAVADVAGSHVGNINSNGVALNLLTATFGPRVSFSNQSAKVIVYGQGLLGYARGFSSVFPGASGATDSASSFALLAGGGANLNVSPRLAIRLAEVDWLRTQLPNGTSDVENNLRLSFGVVLRLR